jgi:DNA-binding NarL/FixJ family response regulator
VTDGKGSEQRGARQRHEAPLSPLRVLPCAETSTLRSRFQAMQSTEHVIWLPVTFPAILASLFESPAPDLIVIATVDFRPSKWPDPDHLKEIFVNTPTILLTTDSTAAMRRRAARFGISSVLPVDVTTPQLLTAIAAAGEGLAVTMHYPFAEVDNVTGVLGTEQTEFVDNAFSEHLTGRETEVLRLIANGRSNKQIASQLRISEHTAKFHVSSVLAKLGAGSRTEAVSLGIFRGLVAI